MNLTDEQLIARIALSMLPHVGIVVARNLISHCISVEAIFQESKSALRKMPNIGSRAVASILNPKESFKAAEKEFRWVKENNVQILFFADINFPRRLKHCIDSPILLYKRGEAELNTKYIVAVVGTRNASDYGEHFCELLIEDLQDCNATIVSGLAYGIDIAAHRASLKYELPTIAVLGHGLERIYPAVHRSSALRIMEQGLLVSEFPHGTMPDRENFPKRNRIIAGLCDATVVVQARNKGGALITANLANSYNRDVFAIPGRYNDPLSEGCNALIKDNKAALIHNADDLKKFMRWDVKKSNARQIVQLQMFQNLREEEKTLVSLLAEKSEMHIDEIALECKMKISLVAALLLELEFAGLVRALPGKQFKLN